MSFPNSVCRVCMVECSTETHDIYEANSNNDATSSLADILAILVPEELQDPEDRISQRICDSCAQKLWTVFELRKQIIESHRKLLLLWDFENNIDIPDMPDTLDEIEDPAPADDESEDAATFLLRSMGPLMTAEFVPPPKKNKKTHQKVPYEQRKFQCTFCDKRFLRKSNLDDHLRLHTKQRPYVCQYCRKSFSQVANYRAHVRIHTAERPFICSICTKSYNQSSQLTIHYRSHTNERNYPCSACEKRFTNSSDLKKHQKTHNPDLPCPMCEKKFAQKSNLKIHVARNHPDNK